MSALQLDAENGMPDSTNDHVSRTTPKLDLKNQLAESPSPYLRSHKDNLVAWQEWSSESIQLAKTYERPIFLSIGYSACHWCHVMSHESFDSPEVASVLNTSFIPIKLDRESRPDLDDIYMNYVTATTGAGGWPLNVFLTPDLHPLFGGTYWPSPGSETPLPKPVDTNEDRPMTFLDVVQKMQEIWMNERPRCLASAADITHQLREFSAEGIHGQSSVHVRGVDDEDDAPEPLDLDLLDDALDHFVTKYDSQYGGFISGAGANGPKFATPANLTLLLRIGASIMQPSTHTRFGFPGPIPGIIGRKSCANAAAMVHHTLQSITRSALHDHLGNGFHRYSVTPDWNLPHFEKMLYDNAQMLAVYCDAWALGRDPEILGTIYDLVEYLTNSGSPIVRKDGGWYASEAADSQPALITSTATDQQMKEGAFYVWTLKELKSILGDHDSAIVARHFGVLEHGNIPRELDVHDEFISQNVFHIDATPSVLAKEFGLKEDEIVRIIKNGKKKLLEFRKSKRVAPEVDDKVVLSYNALAISALARASNTLASIDESRARLSKEAAVKGAAFIKSKMYNSSTGQLTRIYSDHESTTISSTDSHGLAFVDDYAYLIHSLRTLFDLTFERHYLDWALRLQATLDRDFGARNGGYYQAATTPLTEQKGIVSPNAGLGKLSALTKASGADTSVSFETSTDTPRFPEQILNLKPGTDNSLPSPNGIIASNLLYMSSYMSALNSSSTTIPDKIETPSTTSTSHSALSQPRHLSSTPAPQTARTLLKTARSTINAFAPEMIQHPFLYASLLSAVVLDSVTIKSLLIPSASLMSDNEVESRGLRGFGRTLVRSDAIKAGEVMICEYPSHDRAGGVCRLLQDGELDIVEGDDEDETAVPSVSVEVIERREEMARRESLALEAERREREGSGRPLVYDVPSGQEV